jgi:uncharacterized LabA/DUF88 family protein
MPQTRVRIFVDFWNFQLAWNRVHDRSRPKIPWEDVLPNALIAKVAPGDAVYVGTHVYASIDKESQSDRGLSRFLHAMDGFPGYSVTVKERRPTTPPKCNHHGCRKVISECPHCGQQLRRTVEKGIDASLLTDMIKAAFDNTFDVAVLLTEDSDFVPAVRFIQERWTKQIYHAYFRGRSDELRNACWKHIFFDDFMGELVPPQNG